MSDNESSSQTTGNDLVMAAIITLGILLTIGMMCGCNMYIANQNAQAGKHTMVGITGAEAGYAK